MTTILPERVKELREWLIENEYTKIDGIEIPSLRVRQMLAILDEHSALKAEAKRLNTWHSTLSEAWKARAEKSEAENERLKTALWDALKNRPIKVTVEPEGATDLLERLRKAEAELKVAGGTIEEIVKAWCLDKAELVLEKMLTADLTRDVNEAHTQLAKQAPLIEAVMGAGIMTTKDGAGISFNFFTNEDDKRSILRAALAYREGEK